MRRQPIVVVGVLVLPILAATIVALAVGVDQGSLPGHAHWHLSALYPDGAGSSINDVYCQSAGDCIAIGLFAGTSGSPAPLMYYEEVNGKWFTQNFPNTYTVDSGELNALWCSSLKNCVAVGNYTPLGATNESLFSIEVERNGVWTSPTLEPTHSDHLQDGYTSVRCTTINNCAITGAYEVSFKNRNQDVYCTNLRNGKISVGSDLGLGNLLQICKLDGASPGYNLSNDGSYTPFTCPTVEYANCVVVSGFKLYGSVTGKNVMPTKWSKVNAKPPHFQKMVQTFSPSGVSCSPDGLCAETGQYIDSRFGLQHAFLAVGSKGHWTSYEVTPPNYGSRGTSDGVVGCFGKTVCVSTSSFSPPIGGGSSASVARGRGAVTIFDGGYVQTIDTPTPAGALGFTADGVSCPSSTWCTLVGSYWRNGAPNAAIVTLTAKQ